MCVGVLSWHTGVWAYFMEIAIAWGSIAVLSLELFTAAQSAKAYVTRSPMQSLNTNKRPSAQRPNGKPSPPFTEVQNHRQSEVLMFNCDLCLMIQENGLT